MAGSGLGLMISREFIELHGGNIWAESPIQEPYDGQGPGTRVAFRLPLQRTNILASIRYGESLASRRHTLTGNESEKTVFIVLSGAHLRTSEVPIVLPGYRLIFMSYSADIVTNLENLNH